MGSRGGSSFSGPLCKNAGKREVYLHKVHTRSRGGFVSNKLISVAFEHKPQACKLLHNYRVSSKTVYTWFLPFFSSKFNPILTSRVLKTRGNSLHDRHQNFYNRGSNS